MMTFKFIKSSLKLSCSYQNIYIMGNYLKFSRIMSQTPWKVDDKMLVIIFFMLFIILIFKKVRIIYPGRNCKSCQSLL